RRPISLPRRQPGGRDDPARVSGRLGGDGAGRMIRARVRRPSMTRRVLGNGLAVHVVPHRVLPTVAMNLLVRTGSAHNPVASPGLADLTASMLPLGTASRSAETVAENVDSLGATLAPLAGWDSTSIACAALASDTATLLPLLRELAAEPSFPEEELAQ